MADDPQVDGIPIDDTIVAAVVADMCASRLPVETEVDHALRIIDRQRIDALIREREEREAAAREQERRRRESEEHADQARKAVAARQAAQAEARQRLEQQQREQAAAQDRDRLARLEAELAALRPPPLTPEERQHQEVIQAMEEFCASFDAYCNPKRDPLAEIDALHADLAARETAVEQRMAAQREAHRSAKYQADQTAAVSRRESGKW
jgi:hypothetical protein